LIGGGSPLSRPTGLSVVSRPLQRRIANEQRLQRGHADFACANEDDAHARYGVSPAVRQTGAGAAESLLAPSVSRRR